jgi:thioredoxin reductase (NADPH)
MKSCDIAIIGAGPAGLYAAYYAGFRGFSVAVIDALAEAGGQVTAMYPEKDIFDVAGFPKVKGRDLIDGLLAQAQTFSPAFHLSEQVTQLVSTDEAIEIATESGLAISAKAVIITGGIGAFTPRAIPVGMEWLGKGLVHFVPKLSDHADKDVVIVGGGDSAFDWAVSLQPIARSVTLVHRRDAFRAHAATVDAVRAMGVRLITSAEVSAVSGDDVVRSVTVTHKETGAEETLPAGTVVAALGFVANIGPIATWGLELEKRHILVNTSMMTSLDRVFAAGDIATYPGKVPLIAVGFGEAATAVNNAAPFVNPDEGVFPGHSSGSSSD